MSEVNYIFVYGTLKRGYCNERFMKDCAFVSEAIVPFKMFAYRYQGRVSAPMLSRKAGVCHGEVWCLPSEPEKRAERLSELDWLEGVNYGWYTRETIDICDDSNVDDCRKCFVYFHNAPQGEVIENWSDR